MIAIAFLLLLQTTPAASAQAREAELAKAPVERPKDARVALERVLTDRAFQRARANSWQRELQRRVREWLADVWQRTIGRFLGARGAAEVLAWAAAVGAVLVLILWLARLAASERGERPVTMGSMRLPRTPGHVLGAQAAALIHQGRIREGARVAYQAALARLDEEGALRADDARTPRESLRLLSAEHRRHRAFAVLTGIFERAWYGSRAPDGAAGETILTLLQELQCLSFDRAK